MTHVTASAEVTPHAKLRVCEMQEGLKTVYKPLSQIGILGCETLSVGRVRWAFRPNSTEDGGTESTTSWHEVPPKRPLPALLPSVRLSCGTMWMLPAEQKVHRKS